MKTEEELISFETAKLAKSKGFDWKTLNCYAGENNDSGVKFGERSNAKDVFNWNDVDNNYEWISAPTQSLLQRWLRDVHSMNIYVALIVSDETFWYYSINDEIIQPDIMESYEESLEYGLKETLKLTTKC